MSDRLSALEQDGPPTAHDLPRAPRSLRGVSLLIAVAFAFPGAYLVYRNFSTGADPAGLLLSRRTLDPLGRSLILAFTVSAAGLALGTTLAWITARTDVPLRRLWRALLPLPLVFPTFVGAAAFIHALNPGGLANDLLSGIGVQQTPELRGFRGAFFVLTLMTYPYVYLPVSARLRQMPGSIEEAGRVLGETAIGLFWRVCLPQMASSMAAGTLLVFLYVLSDFGAVQLMRYDTLTRAIATNQLANPPVALALSLMLLVLAAAVVVIERRMSARIPGDLSGRVGTTPTAVYRLGRWRWPAVGIVVLSLAAALAAPLAALADWATDGLLLSMRGSRTLTVDTAKVLDATLNTVGVSVAAAIAAVIAVLPIAVLVGRYRSRAGSLTHAVIISTFALPGLLIALSMRFWTLRSPWAHELLSDTIALLIFAYVVRFGSLAMGVTLVAVRSVPETLHDTARTLGAGRFRRLVSVDMPVMAPGLLAAAGLVLLSVMKELPISLLVSPLDFSTLATRIFGSFEDAFIAEAGIMAVVLVALSFVLTWLLVIRRDDML